MYWVANYKVATCVAAFVIVQPSNEARQNNFIASNSHNIKNLEQEIFVMKYKIGVAALVGSLIAGPTHAEAPWAVQQFLNGFFASLIFNAATASTPDKPVYKVGVENGVFWMGESSAIVLKKTTGVDSVIYRFSRLPLNDDGTGSFMPVGEMTVSALTPLRLSQFVSEPGLYTIEATMLASGRPVGAVKKIEFMSLNRPNVSLVDVTPKVTSIRSQAPSAVSVAIQSDIEPTKVTLSIGDTGKSILAVKDPNTGNYTANLLPIGIQAGPYPIFSTVYYNRAKSTSASSADSISVLTPPKITLISAPRLLDATDADVQNSISLKLKNLSPEATLPSIAQDGTQNFQIAWFFMGNLVAVQSPDAPFIFQFNGSHYAAMKAAGLKRLPISAVAFHKDQPDLTASSIGLSIDTVAPWAMPEWRIEKNYQEPLLVPTAGKITLAPVTPFDSTAAKKHKLKWTWSLPSSPTFLAKANGPTISFKASAAGSYPISVVVSDDKGETRSHTTVIQASPPTLSMDDIKLSSTPSSNRVPVSLSPKIKTSSTHPSERVVGYQVLLDGVLQNHGSTIKPIRVTTPGLHTITVKAASNFGNVAERNVDFTAVANQPPSCDSFRVSSSSNKDGSTSGVLIGSQCVDPDGKIKAYSWKINGNPVLGNNSTRAYAFVGCEREVTVSSFASDDSGDTTEHTQLIPRKSVPIACN
jgi:hypothetical protein